MSGDIYLSVTNIGDYAFYGCESITSFSLPYCTKIDQGAFYGCTNLSKVYAPLCSEFMSAFSASLVANLTDVNLNLIVDNSHDKGFSSTSNSTYQPISFYAHPKITNITMNNI